jgi:hypothetical protein
MHTAQANGMEGYKRSLKREENMEPKEEDGY